MSKTLLSSLPGRAEFRAALVVSLALIATGCTENDPTAPTEEHVCTTVYVAGVSIEVTDAATGYPAACGSVLYITEGSYQEENEGICLSGRPVEEQYLWMSGAHERPGIYTLRIEREGYAPWVRTDVVVTADECHVQTVRFEVALVPIF